MEFKRLSAGVLSLSATGLVGIAMFEGYSGSAYVDQVGVQTIGFGTTRTADGQAVKPGSTTTPNRALVMLSSDAGSAQARIRSCVGDVPMYQHEWDAYVSLAYNIGPGAFCGSTLVARLKQLPPDYAGACGQILRWNRAAGVVLPGLKKRREAEFALCMGGAP